MKRVALAVMSVGSDQRHIGILHRSESSPDLLMLHLAWHYDLRNEPLDRHCLWIDPPIPPVRAVQLAAFCRKLARRNRDKIPYALSAPSDCFDASTGDYRPQEGTHGLTCATFVMAVFQAVGLRLVKADTWQTRDEDREWQAKVIRTLLAGRVDQRHIDVVRGELGALRFRPEEVAGAAAHEPWPVAFVDAVRNAETILTRLNSANAE